ncbi:hypothetical protein, partial [Chloroflexus sp. MS-G]|uniref:hypothetical protein n=1 Tax=Chloroflexus sp. MS-G TaxID=1521187 RepID=UPI001F408EF4
GYAGRWLASCTRSLGVAGILTIPAKHFSESITVIYYCYHRQISATHHNNLIVRAIIALPQDGMTFRCTVTTEGEEQ